MLTALMGLFFFSAFYSWEGKFHTEHLILEKVHSALQQGSQPLEKIFIANGHYLQGCPIVYACNCLLIVYTDTNDRMQMVLTLSYDNKIIVCNSKPPPVKWLPGSSCSLINGLILLTLFCYCRN